MPIDFGKLLKENRVKVGITQADLAERAKIEQTYMSRLESGKTNPSLSTIEKLCAGLGMTINEFFGGHSEEKRSPAILIKTGKMPLRELKQFKIKNEVVAIKVFKNLTSFSRHRNIEKEFFRRYILIEKDMYTHPEDLVGLEMERTRISLGPLSIEEPTFLINIKERNLKNFDICVMEKDDLLLFRRYIEIPPDGPKEISLAPFHIDNYDDFFYGSERLENEKVLPEHRIYSFETNDFDISIIRGKVVGIIAKFST